MKKSIAGIAVASLLVLAGCGNSQANLPKNDATTAGGDASKGASSELVVSTFGLSQDIVERDIINPFAEANGVKVTLEVGNASERLTKVQSGGSNIDVIELSQSGSTKGTTEGLFETVTEKEIPNLALLTDGAKEVFQNGGGIPFSINSIAIVYDKEKLGREIKDWSDLWSEDLKGKVAIPDITTTGGPLFLSVAADKGGKALKDDKGAAAFKALEELKPNIVKTYSKSSDLANMFQAGEVQVAVVVDFAIPTVQKANRNVVSVVPESGTYANYNTVNIVKDAKNKENAYKYVNFRIGAENQTVKAKSLSEAPVNKDVKLAADDVKTMTYGDVAKRAKTVDFKLVNENLKAWIDQWNKILNQ